jgi:hypothetical protein
VFKLTDEQFEQLAAANQDLQLELTAKGELIIMPPTGGETGNRNFEVYEAPSGRVWGDRVWGVGKKLAPK